MFITANVVKTTGHPSPRTPSGVVDANHRIGIGNGRFGRFGRFRRIRRVSLMFEDKLGGSLYSTAIDLYRDVMLVMPHQEEWLH